LTIKKTGFLGIHYQAVDYYCAQTNGTKGADHTGEMIICELKLWPDTYTDDDNDDDDDDSSVLYLH
jgi:hypothetical protein